jgi:hypothetical protein
VSLLPEAGLDLLLMTDVAIPLPPQPCLSADTSPRPAFSEGAGGGVGGAGAGAGGGGSLVHPAIPVAVAVAEVPSAAVVSPPPSLPVESQASPEPLLQETILPAPQSDAFVVETADAGVAAQEPGSER